MRKELINTGKFLIYCFAVTLFIAVQLIHNPLQWLVNKTSNF